MTVHDDGVADRVRAAEHIALTRAAAWSPHCPSRVTPLTLTALLPPDIPSPLTHVTNTAPGALRSLSWSVTTGHRAYIAAASLFCAQRWACPKSVRHTVL